MKNIILFGAPGVGKGTQASLLAEKFDLIHLSTGEMLRHEVAEGTPLGLRVKDIMNRGDLVGDDIVVGLIAKALDHGRNELLDEWDQLRLRRACGLGPDDPLISIDVPQEELVRRIHERAMVSNRSDDTEEVIRHRLEEYEAKTRPVLDYYKVSGRLISVDGSGEISETNTRLCQVLQYMLTR